MWEAAIDASTAAAPEDRTAGTPGRGQRTDRMPASSAAIADQVVTRLLRRADESSGDGLPDAIRGRFEGSLGADLSSVRVHTGGESAAAASAVGAQAFTVGNDIHFADGKYQPADPFGLHLLAHEVAHTQQQSGGAAHRQNRLEVSAPGDTLEREADRAADAMISGATARVSPAGSGGVQRKEETAPQPATAPPAASASPAPAPGASPAAAPGASPAPAHGASAPAGKAAPGGAPAAKPAKAPAPPAVKKGAAAPAQAPAKGPPAPASAPESTPMPPGGEAVASGIVWKDEFKKIMTGPIGNVIRTDLEVVRLVPGVGLFTGAVADLIEGYQNIHSLDKVGGTEANAELADMMYARQSIVVVNNVIGHIRYLNTLAEDGLIASVLGVAFTPFTAEVAGSLAGASMVLNTATTLLDVCILTETNIKLNQSAGTPAFNEYLAVKRNFTVNGLTDGVGILLDAIDMVSLGLSQASIGKEAAPAFKIAGMTGKNIAMTAAGVLKNMVGVWGQWGWDKADPPKEIKETKDGEATGAPGEAVGPRGVTRAIAGQAMLAELSQMEGGYQMAAGFVEHLLATPKRLADDAGKAVTAVTGQKDPFVWLRDRIAEGVKTTTDQGVAMTNMMSMAGSAEATGRTFLDGADGLLARIAKIKVPEVKPQKTDLGDNAVAKVVGGAIDKGKQIGAGAANAALGKLQGAVDAVTGPAAAEITKMRADLARLVEFLAAMQVTLKEQIAAVAEMAKHFADALAKCKNVEDVMNLVLKTATSALGGEGITIDDLRDAWTSIRGTIDEGFAFARQVAAGGRGGGGAARAPAPTVAPPTGAPPAPPPPGAGGPPPGAGGPPPGAGGSAPREDAPPP